MLNNLTLKTRSIIVGVLILAAYGVMAGFITQNRFIVMITDVWSGLAVIGIAVLMFPVFRERKIAALSYLVFKYLEGGLMVIAGLIFLAPSLQPYRDTIYNGAHIYVFISGSFVFYYLLYQTKAVPRYITFWGAAGILALLLSTALKLLDIKYPAIDYLLVLIITNEIYLAVWLMTKGISGVIPLEKGIQK